MADRREWLWASMDRLGHEKKKPMTWLRNLDALHEALHELRGGPEGTAQGSIQQSRTWSRWADGLVGMLKMTIRPYLESVVVKERDDLLREGGESG